MKIVREHELKYKCLIEKHTDLEQQHSNWSKMYLDLENKNKQLEKASEDLNQQLNENAAWFNEKTDQLKDSLIEKDRLQGTVTY